MPAAEGRVRTQRLLRSDFPQSLDAEDVEYFKSVPLAAVVDTRTELEIESAPRFFEEAGFNVVVKSIGAGSVTSMIEAPSVEQMYLDMIADQPTEVAAAVGAVADGVPTGAVLVHCTAGKDRTGVVVALTLSVLGVSESDIVANYVQTQANLEGQWLTDMKPEVEAMLAKTAAGKDISFAQLVPILTGSPASAIEAVLAQVQKEHGSTEGFLLANGVTKDQIASLKEHLILA